MKNNKKAIILCLSIIAICLIIASLSYAWLADLKTSPFSTETSIQRTYFESGDGSEGNPFEIARPIQLYYFSWIQQLGVFNMEDEVNPGNVKQYFFRVSADLDMSGYTIPSIGTVSQPFVGGFDGQGHIISNLTVDNSTLLTDIPEMGAIGDQIVGFFGVVGSYNSTPAYSYSTAKNVVTNFCLNNITVITSTPTQSKSLIGIVAGYVNGTVSEVGVSNSNVRVASGISNLDGTNLSTGFSDYTLIGYCEEEYKSSLYVSEILYSEPNVSSIITYAGGGSNNEWGGSIAMQSMYERLVSIFNEESTNYTYNPTRTYYYDEEGELISSVSSSATIQSVKKYANPDIGRFSIYNRSGSTGTYTYLMGKMTDVTIIRQKSTNPQGRIITDGTNYLSLSGTTVVNVTDMANATLWTYNGSSGTVSAVVSGTTRYLNQSGTALITGTSSGTATVWTYDANDRITCVSGSTTYYLNFNNGWNLTTSGYITGYKISRDSNYLSIDGSSIVNITNADNATVWNFTNGTSGYMYAKSNNGITYYLTMTRTRKKNNYTYTLSLDTSQITLLDNTSNKLTSSDCGLRYYYGWDANSTSNATTLDIIYVQIPIVLQSFSVIPVTKEVIQEPDYYTTYFPLAVKNPLGTIVNTDNFGVSSKNTGYVISGSQYLYDGSNTYRDSDIRVSKYVINDISVSLGGSTYDSSKLEILTRSRTSGGVVRVEDNYNFEHTNTNLDSYDPYDVATLGLQKYNNSRVSLDTLLTGKDYVYGLHFMDATISKDRLVTVEKAVVDHSTYTNYQMPMDSINFTLSSNGFINFFAGTYYISGDKYNTTFFSLHQVFRYKDQLTDDAVLQAFESSGEPTIYKLNDGDFYVYENGAYTAIELGDDFDTVYTQKFEYVYMKSGDTSASLYYMDSNNNYFTFANGVFTQQASLPSGYVDINTITDIKEIEKVYGVYTSSGIPNANYDFIYIYKDELNPPTPPEGYALAFDLEWITNPNPSIEMNAVYYFEIPVNEGEYALGSVPNKDGAYLMYLDLSSNAQKVHRTTITDYVTTNIYTYEHPLGVQVVPVGSAYTDDIDSVAMKLTTPFAGANINISRVGNIVTYSFNSGSTGALANYIGDDLVLKDSGGDTKTAAALAVTTVTTRTVTRWDYNIVTEETTVTQTITTVDASGERISIIVKTYVLDKDGVLVGTVEIDNNGVDDNLPISTLTVEDAALVAHTVSSDTTRTISVGAEYSFITDPTEGTLIADGNGETLYCDISIIVSDTTAETAVVKIDQVVPKYRLMDEYNNYILYDMAMKVNEIESDMLGTSINVAIDISGS